ncbi:MAG: sigma-70 family RNA polymerase sigma factor [Pirellulales bacterium]|nr:sigma-70 family RNA polymerase sigma factor [Pirellulales bacterium]
MTRIGPQQLERLLAEHGGPLVLLARQLSTTPEDVVQEALLELVRQEPPPENPIGWIYRVVRNRAISSARRASRRSRHEQTASFRGEPWFRPNDREGLDVDAATEALQKLPLEQRETLVARLWGGLSFVEIADLTGTSSSTAQRRYQAGLVALRERLGIECPEKKNFPPN